MRGPRFVRLFSGVYVSADAPLTPLQRVRAALLPFRGNGFASHASAARVYEVPIPTLPDEHVTVTAAAHRRTHPGIVCHVMRKPRAVVFDGIGVSSPDQLFTELASQVSLVDLVVAKGIYRRPDLTLEKIHRVLLERGEPGVPKHVSDAWRPHFPVVR